MLFFAAAGDWPQWGGPGRDFLVLSKVDAKPWPAVGPPILWDRALGDGYSSFVTDGGPLYTMYRRGSDDVAIALDPATGGVKTESGRHLGAITIAKGQDAKADPDAIAAALVDGVREHGLSVLRLSDAAERLRERAHWSGLDSLTDEALLASLDEWLAPIVAGKRRLSDIDEGAMLNALKSRLGWDGQQALDRLAPAHFTSPAGTTHAIDYGAPAGPTVELRVQALFGLATHPVVGSARTPLVLSLTSPAGRPIQTTRDLPGFWSGSWRDVAKEMRGAYPKHHWPDDPASAAASLKTKKKQGI